MFHKILVCSDGSECALAAVRAGAAIALHYGAEITALNVFHFPYTGVAKMGAWAIAVDQAEVDRGARKEKEAVKRSVCAIFAELDTPHRVIQEFGHPVEAILRVAEREEVDLIVVGSRGLRGVKELFLGSVSSGVMHHASCPVLIVRGDNAPCGSLKFDNIVLASDGSPCAQRAARVAVELARTLATSLTVLNVYEDLSSVSMPGDEDSPLSTAGMEHYAKQWLDYVAQPVDKFAKEAGVICSYIQERGHPDGAIVNFTNKHDVDLVVIGSRGLGGYARMVIGSVSNRVVHHANCPVLIVR